MRGKNGEPYAVKSQTSNHGHHLVPRIAFAEQNHWHHHKLESLFPAFCTLGAALSLVLRRNCDSIQRIGARRTVDCSSLCAASDSAQRRMRPFSKRLSISWDATSACRQIQRRGSLRKACTRNVSSSERRYRRASSRLSRR